MLPERIAQAPPSVCIPGKREAEAAEAPEEVPMVIDHGLAHQIEQVATGDEGARRTAVERLHTHVREADVVANEVAELFHPFVLDVLARRKHEYTEAGL